MRDFMGINGDFFFKPELYRPVCNLLRMYHPANWDLGADTSVLPNYPMTNNGINWDDFYSNMKSKGFTNDATVQIDFIKPDKWKDLDKDGYAYGEALAKHFGPSHGKLLESVEIGNEPSDWDDVQYRKIFQSMAKGLRAGDPKLKIVTASCSANAPDQFTKSISAIDGLQDDYDVLNVHSYAFTEGWPSWRRSYPEDPAATNYLKVLTEMTKYRDSKAPGKEIWLTEFGYDASTQPPADPKFVCVTDTQQAQWLTRSMLVFSSLGIQRAYVYMYNDGNKNSFHSAAGLTRNWEPKPSYYALSHLYKTLGDYRFSKVINKDKDLYVFEYINPNPSNGKSSTIWVVWSPTGSDVAVTKTIPITGAIAKAERMPLKDGDNTAVDIKSTGNSADVPVTESPLYIWLN